MRKNTKGGGEVVSEFHTYPEFTKAPSSAPPRAISGSDHEFAPPRQCKHSRRKRLISSLLAASLLGGTLLGAGALSAPQADGAAQTVAEETVLSIIEEKEATP